MGTAVQIENIGESCFSRPLLLRFIAHAGYQDATRDESKWHVHQLATQGFEILLGKLAVGKSYQPKQE